MFRLALAAAVPCWLTLCCSGCEPPASKPTEAIWYDSPSETSSTVPPVKQADSGGQVETPAVAGEPVAMHEPQPPRSDAVEKDSRYGIGASLQGFRPFPENDPWNQPVLDAAVDPSSDQILAYIGLDGFLHPDFGAGTWNGSKIGIPFIVVPGDQPRVTVTFEAYGDESDPGPYPLPFETPVEGEPHQEGDRHAIVIDRDNWMLYELFRAFPVNGGASWRADSGAIFDLRSNTARPRGWTSADAAGLPIFPGLVRYDEVGERQEIRHALRFTLAQTRRAFVPPASHWASSQEHPLLPPLGMRVRLKSSVDISPFPPTVQVILKALQTYGMILADNGSNWFLSGCPDERWNNDELRTLRKIKVTDLEILKMDGLVTPYSR